ncbi:MAG: transaldolase [Bdellovibrio sp.]|nr:MAG: transaldolase [Bdellovibrio sp.]
MARDLKIFSDGADKASMIELAKQPFIQGLTTNPTLMKKAGITDYVGFAKEILSIIKDKPISFEVFSDDFEEMHRQAREISSWGDNVYVKIPVMNSLGQSSQELIHTLSQEGVKLNVTAILTLDQVKQTCENLNPKVPSVVSVFAGRIADTGVDPLPIMKQALKLCENVGPQTELLWASTREVFNIQQARNMGCHIITVPFDLLRKYQKMNKMDLQDLSLETVKMFKKDAEQAGFTI